MATRKTHDLAVKTGSYTDAQGNARNRYAPVGSVWEKDDGSTFITINRTFNPAGVPNPDNKESILVSRFEIKPRGEGNGQQAQQAPQRSAAPAPAPAAAQKPSSGFDDMDDDIPF